MMLKFERIPSIGKVSKLREGTDISKNLEDALQQSKDIVMHMFDSKDRLAFVNFMVGTTYDESACL